jgi:hypothetical protein
MQYGGGNIEGSNYYPATPAMDNQNEFDFGQFFGTDLDSLELDFAANHPSNYGIPSININRSNTQDSQPPLSPIQTDIMIPGNLSPVFSSSSHTSGSSRGFLSPRHADPLTPSPVSPYEQHFISIPSPEFSMRRFESQSPVTSTLGLSVSSFPVHNLAGINLMCSQTRCKCNPIRAPERLVAGAASSLHYPPPVPRLQKAFLIIQVQDGLECK